MKPQLVELRDATGANEVVERVLQTRLREVRTLTTGLRSRNQQGLHDFRIACKRLRYALERFEARDPSLESAAQRLAELQDALGEVHDRDGLLAILPPAMATTERRLRAEREASVDRAVAIWDEVRAVMEAVNSHRV